MQPNQAGRVGELKQKPAGSSFPRFFLKTPTPPFFPYFPSFYALYIFLYI